MKYFFGKTLNSTFDEAVARIIEALKKEGFGVVSEIDLNEKFKEKLNIDFRKYKIIGACNPSFAYKAILKEEKIGIMLPCNVVVIENENGTIDVAAVHPVASMMAIENPELEPLALEVTGKMQNVISQL